MQKDSKMPTPIQVFIHFGMGAILGALLALALILTSKPASPLPDVGFFVGVLSFAIGMGASMTGFIFTVIELNESQAKRQTIRVKQRQDDPR